MTIDLEAIKRENEVRICTKELFYASIIKGISDLDKAAWLDAHAPEPVISALVAEVEALRAERDRTNAVLAGTGHSIEWDDHRQSHYLKGNKVLCYPMDAAK